MTDADKPMFFDIVARLAIALREPQLDTPQLRVYFAALASFEIEFVSMAAASLATTALYFPKVPEWRKAVEDIIKRRRDEQKELLRKLAHRGTPLCAACGDHGFVEREHRYHRCDCQEQRRRELLGRHPWPALPAAIPQEVQS